MTGGSGICDPARGDRRGEPHVASLPRASFAYANQPGAGPPRRRDGGRREALEAERNGAAVGPDAGREWRREGDDSYCYLRGAGGGGELTIISDMFSSRAFLLARCSVRPVQPLCGRCSLTAAPCHSRTHPTLRTGRPRSPLLCLSWGWGWRMWLCLTRGTSVPNEASPDSLVCFALLTLAEKS